MVAFTDAYNDLCNVVYDFQGNSMVTSVVLMSQSADITQKINTDLTNNWLSETGDANGNMTVDGQTINFTNPNDPNYVGTLFSNNQNEGLLTDLINSFSNNSSEWSAHAVVQVLQAVSSNTDDSWGGQGQGNATRSQLSGELNQFSQLVNTSSQMATAPIDSSNKAQSAEAEQLSSDGTLGDIGNVGFTAEQTVGSLLQQSY